MSDWAVQREKWEKNGELFYSKELKATCAWLFHENFPSELCCLLIGLCKCAYLLNSRQSSKNTGHRVDGRGKKPGLNPDASCKLILTRIPQLELKCQHRREKAFIFEEPLNASTLLKMLLPKYTHTERERNLSFKLDLIRLVGIFEIVFRLRNRHEKRNRKLSVACDWEKHSYFI